MPLQPSVKGKKAALSEKVGLVQWFHIHQQEEVEKALNDFEKLGITHIRTNVSWADWHQEDGKQWYDWLFQKLGTKLKVLPCLLYTPPSLGLKSKSSAPPKNPKAYADFADQIITHYGQHFDYLELWNEPNNLAEYDFTLDPDWNIFCEMIGAAAQRSQQKGKKTVLGGMSPVDPHWLDLMFNKNLIQYIDVVGIHGFPNVFDYNWEGWEAELAKIQQVLDNHQSSAELWITKGGFSTWQKSERQQLQQFIEAIGTKAKRIYWYGLKDLVSELPAVDRFHLDEREYFFGMKHADGSPKLLYTLLATKGLNNISETQWLTPPVIGKSTNQKYTLITGGAGFVGTNLADRLLSEGKPVMVFDNLSRAGVQNNLYWLKEKHPDLLQIMIADIRDKVAVKQAVANANTVFHFAAQVAVTSSLVNPFHDFEVNAQGTLNLLEAIRNTDNPPPIVFTSTNKVYGELSDLGMVMNGTRYHPENLHFRKHGISEQRNLDFHSPYGCSKGVADQYIIDYGRTYGLKTVVFRMSCIYGPHQFGTEDQGWVAHFLIQALKDYPITLYGDGKQVRDILFVEDLVDAFVLAQENMDKLTGNAFNMGGGVNNTVSLLELLELIGKLNGKQPDVSFNEWRPGDQKYYVSDFQKFAATTGWKPQVGTAEGVSRLYDWLIQNTITSAKQQADTTASTQSKNKKRVTY